MRSVMSDTCTPPSGHPGVAGVSLQGVSAEYDGERVLHGVSAEIGVSAVTVVTGANGAGKSTLLAVVAGLHRPVSGRVEGLLGRSIAYVPQRSAVPEHFPVTVREVASMGRWPTVRHWWSPLGAGDRSIVDTSLERLDVHRLASRPFGDLSGGQRQRVLVAQALARQAELLLLDEPTVGLDRESGQAIRTALRAEADRGAMVVEVSHDPVAIADADARLHLEAGRVASIPR